jgi:formate hydrogenlyase subunit 6/NADH:ubiquinone oxidoreductase subunit I
MEACCGCGVCEAVCPVKDCVTMVNEVSFTDNSSQWEAWRKDKTTYNTWLQDKILNKHDRSHGFRFRRQYQEQVPEMLEIAKGNA